MATDADFIAYVLDQAALPGLGHRRMFGEYALYLEGRVVGFACDNQLFLKPTEAARALLDTPREGQPWPGARPHWLLADELEDRLLLQRLLRESAAALPLPAPKTPRRKGAATAKA
jgi:TfoX/Sxy family transcriptional regulator of competence genes